MSDSEQQHSSSHRRFNDDDDEEQHQPDSVTIISPKDYNSIKQCTDLSRRSILNPAIGAPVWTAVRKYIFMQFILFKINDVYASNTHASTTQKSIYKLFVIGVDSPILTQTRTPRSKHGKSHLLFSTASFHMDLCLGCYKKSNGRQMARSHCNVYPFDG